MKSLFQRKIFCRICGCSYKRRVERGKIKYCCSYSELGKANHKRVVIEESFLINCIERRFNKKLSYDEIRGVVEKIEIEDKLLFTIYLNGQEPIIYGRNHIVY
ncbi:hypothetical protein JK635_23970 [Neobacillus sp. YIM B02564]|uniref:Recombinase zinc beta ribbon domain-containing protein n=1 Tax=Neobacillus paridis TaxID=2803862 RepID=A0ABS1TV98_9BACI|nr:hypothetical protein [Neobacillus paridis]MBL4955202.1 hypothetical protein [Neobacillus paridis]